MLKLSDFDHLRSEKMITFKEETIHWDGAVFKFTIISYMIQTPDLWKLPLAKECRGITFNTDTGELVSMPFEKFFNVGENEETQRHNLPTSKPIITDKRDGSMVTPVLLTHPETGEQKVVFKTKKSFYSEVAIEANKHAPQAIKDSCIWLLQMAATPIFEFTHPDWKIVIDYGEGPTWRLIAIRDNYDGAYDFINTEWLSNTFSIESVDKYNFKDINELDPEHTEGVEGWVLYWPEENLRVKLKTKWYLDRHHANTELRERDVVKMILDETIDDMKSFLTTLGKDLSPIERLERAVSSCVVEIQQEVEKRYEEVKHLDRKDVAVQNKGWKYFGLLMKMYSGGEPDYKGFFAKENLQRYSLKTVYSNFV